MGYFIANVQVRTSDVNAVAAAAKVACKGPTLVTRSGSSWVSVYNERIDYQDSKEIGRVDRALSKRLTTDALAFLVHDSDVFMYWLIRRGRVVDRYNSRPDYFKDRGKEPEAQIDVSFGGGWSWRGSVNELKGEIRRAKAHGQIIEHEKDELEKALANWKGDGSFGRATRPKGGDAKKLLALCKPGTSEKQLKQILRGGFDEYTMAEFALDDLAPLLGIDKLLIRLSYRPAVEEKLPKQVKFLQLNGA